jgi:hypothetical protein
VTYGNEPTGSLKAEQFVDQVSKFEIYNQDAES